MAKRKGITAVGARAMPKLTPKQERFAQLVAGGTNQSDAYRGAYNTSRMKPATVNREAKALAPEGWSACV